MAFVNTKYQSNSGAVYRIRLSEDKADLAGEGSIATAITDPNVEAIASEGGRKKFGIHARGVRFSRTVGTAPNTFKKYIFIPAVTPAVQTTLIAGDTVLYKGQTYESPIAVAER